MATATAADTCCRGWQLNERGSAAAPLDCHFPVHQRPRLSVLCNVVSPLPRSSRSRCLLLPARPAAGTAGRPEFRTPVVSQGPTPVSLAVTASELVSCLWAAPIRTGEAFSALLRLSATSRALSGIQCVVGARCQTRRAAPVSAAGAAGSVTVVSWSSPVVGEAYPCTSGNPLGLGAVACPRPRLSYL